MLKDGHKIEFSNILNYGEVNIKRLSTTGFYNIEIKAQNSLTISKIDKTELFQVKKQTQFGAKEYFTEILIYAQKTSNLKLSNHK